MSKVNPIKPAIQGGLNKIRRQLEVANQAVGLRPIGVRLNRSALTRSVVAVNAGYVNKDRYERMYSSPEVSAGFSLVVDMSDSMSYSNNIGGSVGNWWNECCLLVDALADGFQRIAVDTAVAGCFYEYNHHTPEGSSTHSSPIIALAKSPHEKWTPDHFKKMKESRPTGGTDLICYAEAALHLARQMDATHKIAFFLTDGQCSTKRFLESLRQQAQAEGIKLVGIGLGLDGSDLPNGVSASSGMEVARKITGHIEKLLKSKTGIEANDD